MLRWWLEKKEFRAYKGILAARSSVFAAMFRHHMEEHKQNRVTIDDIEEQVFSEVLYFIYTHRAPSLNEMALELLAVAEKYALQDLKAMCEEALIANRSVQTAVKTLVMAELHSAKQLKVQTIKFINRNASNIITTENWQNVKEHYPSLIEEAYSAMVIHDQLN